MTSSGLDAGVYIRFVASLVLVLGLILAMLWALRRFGFGGMVARAPRQRRLSVVESLAVDAKRRLVLVRRDGVEHLLLVGGTTDLVVEPDIEALPATSPAASPAAEQFAPHLESKE